MCTLIGLAIVLACTPKAGVPDESISKTKAWVKDMRGLDGCTFLLITDKKKKLLPANIDRLKFIFKDGQRVEIKYRHQKDAGGTCMAEDEIIEVLSIKELKNNTLTKPAKKECVQIMDPVNAAWSKEILIKENPYRMWRYSYQDGFAYYFMAKTRNLLYDCQGNFMCEDKPNARTCVDNITELTEGKVLWTRDE